jgi:arylsulfatase
MGDWKAVRQNMLQEDNEDPLRIELYNLREDIGESRDLAADHPEIVERMREIMEAEHTPSEIFPMGPIDK